MKGKSKYLIFLFLLLVICSGIVTYAWYATRANGAGTVNSAKWNVSFKNGEDSITNNFNINLGNATWTNGYGNVASGKIAPGSSTTFNITLDATGTETDVDYTVEIWETQGLEDFEILADNSSGTIDYSTETGAMVRNIPITILWNGGTFGDTTKEARDVALANQNLTIPITIIASQKMALRYTVYFSSNGSTVATKRVDEGTQIGTLPEAPTRLGYTFTGWFTSENGGSEVTATTEPSGGTIYYAHWTEKYVTVSFNSDGGSSVSSIPVQEGSTFANSNINIPTSTKDGYDFNKWYDSNNNELTTSTVIMSNITFTADWIRKVCILSSGTSKTVGSKYSCDLGDGELRNFYVLKVNTDDVKLIMERNITDTILVNNSKLLDWNSAIHFFDEGNPGYSITGAWDNVISISLPSIQDIADAGGITNFNYETDSSCAFFGASNLNDASKKTNYIWLYDYSRACSNHGCTNSLPDIDGYPFGYWTLDSVANNSNNAWIVGRGGRTDILNKSEESVGLRPVIKV